VRFVFLPGLDGTGFLFEPITRMWPNGLPPPLILAYPSDHFLNYDQLEAYIRPKLPPTEPYVLIAESFGGPLATRIAARQPAMLRGLVLSATFIRRPRGRLGMWGRFLIGPYIFKKGLAETFGRLALFLQGINPHQREMLLKAIEYAKPEVLAARLKETLEVDVVNELRLCEVPVLCLYAKNDWVIERKAHDMIVKANPRVAVVGLDGPHFLLQAKPAEALQEIFRFAESLSAQPSA
jgi:pimeloyl-[acyl-carrier protein] methyl ester esterase